MPTDYTLPPRLKLVIDHMKAVRTIVLYLDDGLDKDMNGVSNYLQKDLGRSVFRPAGWDDPRSVRGILRSSPVDKPMWQVVKKDGIAVEVCPATPLVDDDEPYVNLYVPPAWKKRDQFIAALKGKAPAGFTHVSQSPDECTDETSVFKYLAYTDYVGADGLFDFSGFVNGMREAAKALVAMEQSIDAIL